MLAVHCDLAVLFYHASNSQIVELYLRKRDRDLIHARLCWRYIATWRVHFIMRATLESLSCIYVNETEI